jgi:hypothetical protein
MIKDNNDRFQTEKKCENPKNIIFHFFPFFLFFFQFFEMFHFLQIFFFFGNIEFEGRRTNVNILSAPLDVSPIWQSDFCAQN